MHVPQYAPLLCVLYNWIGLVTRYVVFLLVDAFLAEINIALSPFIYHLTFEVCLA